MTVYRDGARGGIWRYNFTLNGVRHSRDCSDDNLITLCQRCLAIHEIRLKRARAVTAQRAGSAAGDLFQGALT